MAEQECELRQLAVELVLLAAALYNSPLFFFFSRIRLEFFCGERKDAIGTDRDFIMSTVLKLI